MRTNDQSQNLSAAARAMFKRRGQLDVSDDELREIAQNATGFFTILREWDAAGKASNTADSIATSSPADGSS
jgi:hypothetical protein